MVSAMMMACPKLKILENLNHKEVFACFKSTIELSGVAHLMVFSIHPGRNTFGFKERFAARRPLKVKAL